MAAPGKTQESRSYAPVSYMPSDAGGRFGGGTLTSQDNEPTIEAYENIFGPSARDIKSDLQRFKRHGRWHLPDILKGPNMYLTDRIDGLITDATNSPFTSRILPYKYFDNVDGKIKWNVWSFDEGLASRVPYESAARVLAQTKRSYAGYTVRSGLAIVLEHNFMMKPAGRENFKNQLTQLVGSIQMSNDLDVHMALVLAESHAKTMRENYLTDDKSGTQVCREFVDLFGFVQKNTNAMDILIEEAKSLLKQWGGPMPDFLLCNSKLTFQLTMTPEVTSYTTQGPEGPKRLRRGPDLQSYRGIGIIHTRAFSMENGAVPRDILRRRVRVAEYYRIAPHADNYKRSFQFYNEERDTFFSMSFLDLLRASQCTRGEGVMMDAKLPNTDNNNQIIATIQALEEYTRMKRETHIRGTQAPGNGNNMQLGTQAFGTENNPSTHPMAMLGALPSSVVHTPGLVPDMVKFITQLLGGRLNPEFVWPFVALNKHWLYVPGAYDFTYAYADAAVGRPANPIEPVTQGLPDFMKDAIRQAQIMYPDRMAQMTTRDYYMFGRYAIQSIAEYPRPLERIGDRCHNRPYTRGVSPYSIRSARGVLDIIGFPTVQDEFMIGWRTRNYLRYGIPLHCVADVRATTYATALDFQENPGRDEYDPYLLRPIGVFFCPNHFGHPREKYPRFRTVGDQIGYNLILTGTLVQRLMANRNPLVVGRDPWVNYHTATAFRGTFLYEVLKNPEEHHAFIQVVAQFLTTVKANFKDRTGSQKRRTHLSDDFYKAQVAISDGTNTANYDFLDILENRNYKPRVFSFDASHYHLLHMYWMWPSDRNTTKQTTNGDVLHVDSRSPIRDLFVNGSAVLNRYAVYNDVYANTLGNAVAKHAAAVPAGQAAEQLFKNTQQNDPILNMGEQLWVTTALIDAMAHDIPDAQIPQGEQFFEFVDLANYTDEPLQEQDAVNFLHMLAWRIFADQTRPLPETVMRTGVWGSPDDYLVWNPPPPSQVFGGGLIDPSVAAGAMSGDRLLTGAGDVEVVVVRPNIEHYMLGIILGMGGEGLGSTFWGQTELSCYDDSMHGIWGMSYKYNSRAIVIDNKNLVRLWDVAYDSYTGGKNDTTVDWNSEDQEDLNSAFNLREYTQHVTRTYRGPSMLVMAFHHGNARLLGNFGAPKVNWPSPIVFHDDLGPASAHNHLPADFENVHVVNTHEFRVFNSPLYENAYKPYYDKMPGFTHLHSIRKNAGQSTTENEVSTDSLAFQGTMRIFNEEGRMIQEILGSGHHGVDFVGVNSLRNGRGYKIASQPEARRMV